MQRLNENTAALLCCSIEVNKAHSLETPEDDNTYSHYRYGHVI